jgi:hypothetical protein
MTDRILRGGVPEGAGTVDHAFDSDRPSGQPHIRSDAACTIAWRRDGYEAVTVHLDPALVDRAPEICGVIEGLTHAHGDAESLGSAILEWTGGEALSASIHDEPRDPLSVGLLVVAITLG